MSLNKYSWNVDEILLGSIHFTYPYLCKDKAYWLSNETPTGKSVLVQYNLKTRETKTINDISPSSRIYEYGGRSFCIQDNEICYYSTSTDLVEYNIKDATSVIIDNGITGCPLLTPFGLLYIKDELDSKGYSCIYFFSFANRKSSLIFGKHSYTSDITYNADSGQLSWTCGDAMPWDETFIYEATISPDGVGNIDKKIHKSNTSLLETTYDGNNLYYLSDENNWWNIYNEEECIVSMKHDFTTPSWTQGCRHYAIENNNLIASYLKDGESKIFYMNIGSKEKNYIKTKPGYISEISNISDNNILIINNPISSFPEIYLLDINNKELETIYSVECKVPPSEISIPKSIFEPKNNVHSFFYPPSTQTKEKFPLLIKIHGGPTSQSYYTLDPKVQFWTCRGFGVLDINYRGSSGFGKEYRDILYNNWGIVDIKDCISSIKNLLEKNSQIDKNRLHIRGSSAGGFTMLNILANSDLKIASAACYYGVSDLHSLLNHDIHTLENNYLHKLLGDFDSISSKSPSQQAENIKSNIIFFQGSKDSVVPPEQSITMLESLKDNGIKVFYKEYFSEGHGFRDPSNIEDSLSEELDFYTSQ